MKLLIISGLSGSGKSIALNTLEDLDHYCVDNLPITLLKAFGENIAKSDFSPYENFAVGIDARNQTNELINFPEIVDQLKELGLEVEIVFLQTSEEILIKRFSETRRKHPLSTPERNLVDSINYERELLLPILSEANLIIDTSNTNIYQLRDNIIKRIGNNKNNLSVLFKSFGFKNRVPNDADFVFDVRCLPNPYWETRLRPYTGLDKPIIDFLEKHSAVNSMYLDIASFIKNWIPEFEAQNRKYLTIAIGCTGGHHRSVFLVEKLAEYFRTLYKNTDISVYHRELT
ncbi:MAG: RNase adapter RapZ [Gammaproteobacteria bacterium]|nr:MAG: RNase adapter RapZ [Gammaproteobacteria bacterium]